jgi:hypothetical protein
MPVQIVGTEIIIAVLMKMDINARIITWYVQKKTAVCVAAIQAYLVVNVNNPATCLVRFVTKLANASSVVMKKGFVVFLAIMGQI